MLLFQSFSGPARTNSLGKAFLESASIPVVVAEDGTIAAGADLVVLDRDYFSVPEEDIKRIRPLLTMVAGKVVPER